MQTLAADAASEMGVELFSSIIIISYWVQPQPYLWGLWWGVHTSTLGRDLVNAGVIGLAGLILVAFFVFFFWLGFLLFVIWIVLPGVACASIYAYLRNNAVVMM